MTTHEALASLVREYQAERNWHDRVGPLATDELVPDLMYFADRIAARVERETLQAVISDAAIRLIEDDPHQWSKRPCPTCRSISSLIGKPFGCNRRAAQEGGDD